MTEPNRPEEHKRGYYAVVLVAGVALSVAGNALHAHAVTGGSVLASVGAAVFPLLLLMMTELTVLTAKRFGGWVRAVTAGLAAVVAVISFAISYEALAYAARELFGIERHLAWLAPLTVDLPIIGATLALWAASDLIRRSQAAVADQPTVLVADDRPMPVVPPVPVDTSNDSLKVGAAASWPGGDADASGACPAGDPGAYAVAGDVPANAKGLREGQAEVLAVKGDASTAEAASTTGAAATTTPAAQDDSANRVVAVMGSSVVVAALEYVPEQTAPATTEGR